MPILDLQAPLPSQLRNPPITHVPETGIARNRTRRADKNPRKFAESPADRRVAAKILSAADYWRKVVPRRFAQTDWRVARAACDNRPRSRAHQRRRAGE